MPQNGDARGSAPAPSDDDASGHPWSRAARRRRVKSTCTACQYWVEKREGHAHCPACGGSLAKRTPSGKASAEAGQVPASGPQADADLRKELAGMLDAGSFDADRLRQLVGKPPAPPKQSAEPVVTPGQALVEAEGRAARAAAVFGKAAKRLGHAEKEFLRALEVAEQAMEEYEQADGALEALRATPPAPPPPTAVAALEQAKQAALPDGAALSEELQAKFEKAKQGLEDFQQALRDFRPRGAASEQEQPPRKKACAETGEAVPAPSGGMEVEGDSSTSSEEQTQGPTGPRFQDCIGAGPLDATKLVDLKRRIGAARGGFPPAPAKEEAAKEVAAEEAPGGASAKPAEG